MSRLRDSLGQLRHHLEGIQNQQRSQSPSSDTSQHQKGGNIQNTNEARRTRSLSRDKGPPKKPGPGRTRRNSDQSLAPSQSLLDLLANSRPKRSDTSGSNESLSTWERRKMYDSQRRKSADEAAEPEIRSRRSSGSSSTSSKSRSRRSLPKIPPAANINERKKQITKRAVEKIRKAGSNTGTDTSSLRSEESLFVDLESEPEYAVSNERINVQSIEESVLLAGVSTLSAGWEHCNTSTPRETGFKPLHPHPVTEPRPETPEGSERILSDNLLNAVTPVNDDNAINGYKESINNSEFLGRQYLQRPTLHKLLKSCDLHYVTLETVTSGDVKHLRGLTLFESLLSDLNPISTAESTTPPKVFNGRRPILGQNGSAFVRVKQPEQDTPTDTGNLVAMTTVRGVDRTVTKETEGRIQSGDHLIEVGGTDVLRHNLSDVTALVDQWRGPLELVIARPKSSKSPEIQTNTDFNNLRRELEKCKIKQDSALQEAERYMDMLADLKLELLSRNDVIHGLQLDLSDCQGRLKAQSEEALRNIANLRCESSDKDNKIQQLECLLLQQSEAYTIAPQKTNKNEFLEYEYEGSRISAV